MSAIAKGCGAAAILVAGACVPFGNGPGRYLLCDPVSGSTNVTDKQVIQYKDDHPGTTFAAFFEGIGLSCDNPPAGYVDRGVKVTQTGKQVPSTVDNSGGSQAAYELFTK